MGESDKAMLHQQWMHSHEDDTEDTMVFRPADYAFPASRGRMGFDLRPDQSMTDLAIAPTDATAESVAEWDLVEDGEKTLRIRKPGEPDRRMQVVSIEPHKLVVRKPE